MRNFAQITIEQDIKDLKSRIFLLERAFKQLREKESPYAKQHLTLLAVHREALDVYEKARGARIMPDTALTPGGWGYILVGLVTLVVAGAVAWPWGKVKR